MENVPKIIQSQNDQRIYHHIILPNSLSCLLISDKDADKAAASLSVGVGSLEDPHSTQGLAHFLEHMLFLGTEKFPDQSEYKAYLSKNSGSSNAYTSSDETVFYFSCSTQAFEGAIDRFSQFFITPLFNADCSEREMQAVNSEHQKNLMNDSWKMMQLIRSSALKHTAYNHFSTGDLHSLQKPGIRDELIEFYKKYYSANIMKLVLYGKENIEEIEKLAIQYFSTIKNQKIIAPKYIEMPFTSENLAKFYHVKSIKAGDKLIVVWYIENLRPYFTSNPGTYLSFLLGHEGKNSLLSYLIDEGLALELNAGSSNEINLFTKMQVSIKLTKKGLEMYRDVCEILFKYLNILKDKGIQKYIFKEKQYINKLKFDLKEKEKPENYVTNISSAMQIYPIENVLNYIYLLEYFQPELIQKILNQLNYDNMRIYLISDTFENLDSIEPIYNTHYTEKPFDSYLIKKFQFQELFPQKTKKILDLPIPNHFLPRDLSLYKNEESELPLKILETPQSQVYFKQDNKFFTPKANVYLRIYSKNEKFPCDIKGYLSAKIWSEMIYNELRETIYLAKMAHLNANLFVHSLGLDLHFSGFNDGLLKLVDEITLKVANNTNENYDIEKFHNIYQNLLQEYSDFEKGQPISITKHLSKILMETDPIYYIKDLYENLKQLKFEDFLEDSAIFFKSICFEWFAIGNLRSEDVKKSAINIEKMFRSENLPSNEIPKIRIIEFAINTSIPYYELLLSEKKQKNSAILMIFQDNRIVKNDNFLNIWLLSDILKEPYFTQLRTNEQLGYIVSVGPAENRGVCSLHFSVQSERRDPHYLASRIWKFLNEYKNKLLKLDIDEFEKFKKSIIVKILQKDLSIWSEGSRYWDEILKHRYQFNKKEIEAKILEQTDLEEFLEFVRNLIYEKPKVVEIMIVSQNHVSENEVSREDRNLYEDFYHKGN